METEVCIYCGRTLARSALLEKGGKYRCKDEDDCLDYQTRMNSPDSPEEPEDLSGLVKSLRFEAAQRIAAYRTAREPAGGGGDAAEEETEARGWMTSALAALAAEYREKPEFQFHAAENGGGEISFPAGDRSGLLRVRIAPLAGSRYALTAACGEPDAGPERIYREFIYKSYPDSGREDLLQDLSVLLLVCAEGEGERPALLSRFRREIEARCYRKGEI